MGKVITVKGYKAFRGTLAVLWSGKPREELYGDWLYTPTTNQWHCGEKSYPADRCVIVAAEQVGTITVNGYKMFTGTLRAAPPGELPEENYGSWLYDPKTNRWYSNSTPSYPADICKIVGVA